MSCSIFAHKLWRKFEREFSFQAVENMDFLLLERICRKCIGLHRLHSLRLTCFIHLFLPYHCYVLVCIICISVLCIIFMLYYLILWLFPFVLFSRLAFVSFVWISPHFVTEYFKGHSHKFHLVIFTDIDWHAKCNLCSPVEDR